MAAPSDVDGDAHVDELEYQARDDALRAEIAALLVRSGDSSEMLDRCCRVIVERLGVTFVRIWTLLPSEQVLKLEASAGLYTRLDGSHARVPVGRYKIGLIASERRPHLTNHVVGDDRIHDQAWAEQEHLQAFAGYPLEAEGELVGVLAMFSRQQITHREFANLEIVAAIIANYIRRKHTEKELLLSELRFRGLAESVAVIPWEADAKTWEFTYVGPQAAQILGYPVADWYAPDFWPAHVHPDDCQYAINFCRERIDAGDVHYQFEYRMIKPDGKVIWILDIVNVLYGEQGPKTLQGFLIDISDRKRDEQKLQESQQRLQLMADALPVLIAYIDTEERYQFNNAAYEKWFGLPVELYRGKKVCEFLGNKIYETIRTRVAGALAGQPQTFENRVTFQTVGTRDVHVHYVPHRTADGNIAGFFALTIDVSDRKQAADALLDREARLRAILNTAPDGIITIDEHGIIDGLNPAAERLFGYAASELIGENINVLVPPPFHEVHEKHLSGNVEGSIRHLIGSSGRELPARRKDGSFLPIELSVSEVQVEKRWFTGIIHDLTRRKALEAQVLEVSSQEQQRIARELHDGVGQELTGLSLLSDALARRLSQGCPNEQALVAKLSQGLERVHDQVRALCRGLILTDLDPDALEYVLQDLAKRTTEQTGVNCTLECPEQFSIADPMTAKHLYRIVQEAVSNALQHGRPENIWIRMHSTPSHLRVSVGDDGVGVTEQTGGPGMGIPTMRYRANMIGGILHISPAAGGGTLVTCTVSQRKTHVNHDSEEAHPNTDR